MVTVGTASWLSKVLLEVLVTYVDFAVREASMSGRSGGETDEEIRLLNIFLAFIRTADLASPVFLA